jgi:hypothetical protein
VAAEHQATRRCAAITIRRAGAAIYCGRKLRHPPVAAPNPSKEHDMTKALLSMLVLLLAGAAGYTWLTLHWSYASGERSGYVQKLSKKGYVCKTWEGEMAMVSMPGTLSEKFLFTIPDAAVAAKINASVGKRVALQYEQHKWVPSSCFGDTEYFVTDVRVTE